MIDRIRILNNVITDRIEGYFYNGDLFGLKLIIDTKTGFFNATQLCSSAGKIFFDWTELEESKNLEQFVFVKFGRRPLMYQHGKINQTTFGDYVCSELLLGIASWAFPEYYLDFNKLLIYEAGRIKFLLDIDEKKIIKNKLDRILFQLTNEKPKIKHKCKLKCDTYVINCVTDCPLDETEDDIDYEINTRHINDKLDKILFHLEKPQRKQLKPKPPGNYHWIPLDV